MIKNYLANDRNAEGGAQLHEPFPNGPLALIESELAELMCLQRILQSYIRGQANLIHVFIPMGSKDSISSTGRGQARGPMDHVR